MTLFSRLLARTRHSTVAAVYGAIVAAARHPRLYDDWAVPDTVDGRFDMVALHLILVLDCLRGQGPGDSPFAQELTDYFFADMDRSLREMGAGDLSVGKKVRRMAEAFYGRAKAYAGPLATGNRDGLAEALARNVYGDSRATAEALPLAAYAISASLHLHRLGARGILEGRLEFREPEAP